MGAKHPALARVHAETMLPLGCDASGDRPVQGTQSSHLGRETCGGRRWQRPKWNNLRKPWRRTVLGAMMLLIWRPRGEDGPKRASGERQMGLSTRNERLIRSENEGGNTWGLRREPPESGAPLAATNDVFGGNELQAA
ncbi:MAG: hypothetical protein ACREXY_17250 [Gammaproteobacteria bacterium]